MSKKGIMAILVLLVIIGGAIGGAIIFLTQRPNAPVVSPVITGVRQETKS